MSSHRPRRKSPGVNAGSMADIAFLLLIFFLVTTTIAEESGVLVRLPPWETEPPPPVPTSEVLTVLVNGQDALLVEERPARVADLPALLRDHVLSPARNPKQAVVSLLHDRGTSYARYLEVYDALLAGYHRMWDELAHRRHGRAYRELAEGERRDIRAAIPLILSEAEPSAHF